MTPKRYVLDHRCGQAVRGIIPFLVVILFSVPPPPPRPLSGITPEIRVRTIETIGFLSQIKYFCDMVTIYAQKLTNALFHTASRTRNFGFNVCFPYSTLWCTNLNPPL